MRRTTVGLRLQASDAATANSCDNDISRGQLSVRVTVSAAVTCMPRNEDVKKCQDPVSRRAGSKWSGMLKRMLQEEQDG